MPVTRTREVYLAGNYYPALSAVKVSVAPTWAAKQVVGDYTKESERFTSSVNSSDHRAGIGLKNMKEANPAHAARSWWSTAEIGFAGHLVLPPLATDCGNPTAALTDCAILIEFNNLMYGVFGPDVRYRVEGTASWSASLKTLSATPTDAWVHKKKLYFACGTDFERFDGTNWTTGAALSGAAKATRYLLEWDGKLFILSNAGALQYSVNEGVAWTASAVSTLETGMHTSLFNDRNASGTILPHMGTKIGVYILDFTNAVWQETGLRFPQHDYACLGATTWRDVGFIPVGIGVYQVSSDPAVITPMGPSLDDGLPADLRGNIIKLLNEHNALYALVDATTEQARNLYLGSYVIDGVFYDNVGFSAVLKWNGIGWACVYLSGNQAVAVKTGVVASADNIYRLWFAVDRKVFYIPLDVNLQNPTEISDHPYSASAEHIWPWFDADNDVIDKLAFGVRAFAEGTSATEYFMLYYGLDGDDNTWTLLTNATFPDGKIDANGEAAFTMAAGVGLNFKSMRLKAVLYRGSTTTVSPDLRWLRLDYIKLGEVRQMYQVDLDLTRDYRHKRASTLLEALKTAADSKTLGDFSFRSFQGTPETRQVKVLSLNGVEAGAKLKTGQFRVMLLEP